ncbi:hypothetical protein L9F63_001888, partial [Diploptera punctata]
MAETISLDKSSQSSFTKAIRNIKTLMKEMWMVSKNGDVENEGINKKKVPKAKDVMGEKPKKKTNPKFLGRGVVYLRHIPKGFHEEQMSTYFNQFGRVTRLNLVRSKRTGKPKGYAFIEFLYSEVAQVVAETMNNYLMFGKVLKAEYIPGDKIHRGMFAYSNIRPDSCPLKKKHDLYLQKRNRVLTDEEVKAITTRQLENIERKKKQLQENGIDFDCQVEGDTMSLLNNCSPLAIVEFNEIDSGVENKVRRKSLKQKNRKRSLSESPILSTPAKKHKTSTPKLKKIDQSNSIVTTVVLSFPKHQPMEGEKDSSSRRQNNGHLL